MESTDRDGAMGPRLRGIAWVFARFGNFTFGGGSATLATIQHEVVDRRRWLGLDAFHLCFALSRLTPGTNLLACCTGVGWLVRRWSGAVVALLAASVPCSLLALALTVLYEVWNRSPLMRVALHGALAAAVAVMVITGVTLIRPFWRSTPWIELVLFVGGAFATTYFLGVPPLRVLLASAVVGWLWPQKGTA